MGTELLLYDAKSDQVHILNETALQVWQMCDGRHETEEIAIELAKRYPEVDIELLKEDTNSIIEDFQAKGIVTLEE